MDRDMLQIKSITYDSESIVEKEESFQHYRKQVKDLLSQSYDQSKVNFALFSSQQKQILKKSQNIQSQLVG